MRDYLNLGPTPADEPCASINTPNFEILALEECKRFRELIRKKLGPEPDGAKLAIKQFTSEWGLYPEVICYYDSTKPASIDFAFRCEAEAPTKWDDMTVDEVVTELGITNQETINCWLKGGSFPGAHQTSEGWRFSRTSVDEVKARLVELRARNDKQDLMPQEIDDDSEPPLL